MVKIKLQKKIKLTNKQAHMDNGMSDEKGKEIKKNVIKWRDLAREAVSQGGSSDKNIDEFVAKLSS